MNPAWSLVLTAIGVTAVLVARRSKPAAWGIGFLAQGVWATYAVVTRQPGFLLGSIVYAYVYALSWWTWRRDQTQEKTEGQTPDQRLQELAYEMLSLASPDTAAVDRTRYAEVLIRFSKTAAAWEEKQGRDRKRGRRR
ncbi:nicotinamide mononucleotide transporter [Streptomyces sp. NBC_01242]|uniref:nicotinamide mononucleotide transporter n=1 Tax=Streptomyces sp. NBC_01242 TaxID=2903795 RepID=UPI00225A177B|nr:nicotinamide mononucleotide transporter [Streptomyces sp. NBC_01242]MCX4799685.1 nicotinamide mononucleotide transporter [Streptomyces sp. NBC_01242]